MEKLEFEARQSEINLMLWSLCYGNFLLNITVLKYYIYILVEFPPPFYLAFLRFILKKYLNLVWAGNHSNLKKKLMKKSCIPRQYYYFFSYMEDFKYLT